jgi:hypothetical protein
VSFSVPALQRRRCGASEQQRRRILCAFSECHHEDSREELSAVGSPRAAQRSMKLKVEPFREDALIDEGAAFSMVTST